MEVLSKASGAPSSGRVAVLLARVAKTLRCGADEVSVLFCGDFRMRRLNRRYRGQDRPTDVLAFPARDGHLLGDIVVSVPYAARQARRHGEPVFREVDRLLVHGFLHLMGYDHETDSGQMAALERTLRRRLGLLCADDRASGNGRKRR